MPIRATLPLVGLLFILVGAWLIRGSFADPAPRTDWRFDRFEVLAATFVDTQKAGRRFRLEAEGSDTGFALDHVQKRPGLEEQLRDRVVPGVEVEVGYVPRRGDGGWEPTTAEPRPILVLTCGDEVLVDRDRDAPAAARLIAWGLRGAGGLAALLGLAMILATLRLRRSTSPA
jgi:hypothetical protein